MGEILPWHERAWSALMARHDRGTLPHALLVSGPPGLGKRVFGETLARALLCERPREDGRGCGACGACRLSGAGTHPDYLLVGPEEDSKVIKIGQVRRLIRDLGLTSQRGGFRVAVLAPADRLNKEAANALLKTLEEPGARTLLVLVTSHPALLSATIRSRCQKVTFGRPPAHLVRPWLAQHAPAQDADMLLGLAGGAPLAALALAEGGALERRQALAEDLAAIVEGTRDPLAVAAAWHKERLQECIDWLSSWVMDMIRLKLAAQPPGLANRDLCPRLQPLAQRVDLRCLFGHLDRLWRAAQLAHTPVSGQAVLEEVLIPWRNAGTGR